VGLLGRGVRGHYYGGRGRVRGRREVGVVHERDVGEVVGAGCEMEESSILETLDYFGGQSTRYLKMGISGGGLVVERRCFHD